MKTLTDLIEQITEAVQQITKINNWFYDFSGHVNEGRDKILSNGMGKR